MEGANSWGQVWCAACNSVNRTCSTSTLSVVAVRACLLVPFLSRCMECRRGIAMRKLGGVTWVLLQISWRIQQWKQLENRPTFMKVMNESIVAQFFWLTLYIVRLCIYGLYGAIQMQLLLLHVSQKTAPFYFWITFVKPRSIVIIWGRHMPK